VGGRCRPPRSSESSSSAAVAPQLDDLPNPRRISKLADVSLGRSLRHAVRDRTTVWEPGTGPGGRGPGRWVSRAVVGGDQVNQQLGRVIVPVPTFSYGRSSAPLCLLMHVGTPTLPPCPPYIDMYVGSNTRNLIFETPKFDHMHAQADARQTMQHADRTRDLVPYSSWSGLWTDLGPAQMSPFCNCLRPGPRSWHHPHVDRAEQKDECGRALQTCSARGIGRGTRLGYGSKYRDSGGCWGFAIEGSLFGHEGNPSARSWMILRNLSASLLEEAAPDMQSMGSVPQA
jgi:hypothetical protein